jgi:hypothetical protein
MSKQTCLILHMRRELMQAPHNPGHRRSRAPLLQKGSTPYPLQISYFSPYLGTDVFVFQNPNGLRKQSGFGYSLQAHRILNNGTGIWTSRPHVKIVLCGPEKSPTWCDTPVLTQKFFK